MSEQEALQFIESLGWTVTKVKSGFRVIGEEGEVTTFDTLGDFLDAVEELLADTVSSAASGSVPWWDEQRFGPFPVKETEFGGEFVPDYTTALAIARQFGVTIDPAQALRDAMEGKRAEYAAAVEAGETEEFAKLAMDLRDLGLEYAAYQKSLQPTAEQPEFTEQFLGTVEDGGWQIDQYGYTDANGQQVITARQARQPIKDPILSIDEMIAQALKGVPDLNDLTDPNLMRATALRDFKLKPTDQERLQLAMQIAQTPSDYLTLAALYTGAIERETPARVGERVAPLMPFLQQLAQKFFLDIPGINEVPPFVPPEAVAPEAPAAELPPPTKTGAATGRLPAAPGERVLSPALQALKEERLKEGVIPQDIVEQIKAGTFTPTPLPGETPAVPETLPSFTTPTLSPLMQERQQMGTISPDVVAQIKAGTFMPTPLPGEEQPSPNPTPIRGSTEWLIGQTSDPRLKQKLQQQLDAQKNKETIPSFQQGGMVPGMLGFPQMIQAEGGEMVLPNDPNRRRELLQQSGILGDVFRPQQQELGTFLTQPAKTQIPSLIGGGFRFRSAQTRRNMTPTQRALFEAGIQSFGIPWADFAQQEQMATGVGGGSFPSLHFRPSSTRRR
ncbi:MAG: hypothetical protein U0990_00940 [Candidatus Nanopelagicales bacterium]|nr:hypothetical protein [Candidatus Nanopelagicales bacterium]